MEEACQVEISGKSLHAVTENGPAGFRIIEQTRCSWYRRCACFLVCMCMLLQAPSAVMCSMAAEQTGASAMAEVTFSELNDESVFIKQSQAKLCTLASAAMMVRRAAMLSGTAKWQKITEASVRKDAWIENTGLKWDFQTAGITVAHKQLASADELSRLLAKHPEGIVIYDASKPHAIFVTDYTNGIFYCSDPSKDRPSGRYPVSMASITIASAGWCWYVKSPSNLTVKMDADLSGQDLENERQPGGTMTDSSLLNENGLDGISGENQSNDILNEKLNNKINEDISIEEDLLYEKKYMAGNLMYRILDEKEKTAACIEQAKIKTAVSVPAAVKLDGKRYKVVQIAEGAFENSTKLKSVTVGANVTSIGERAFANCKKLKKIIINAEKLQIIGTEAFEQIHKKVQVLLWPDLENAYKQTEQMETFAALLTGTSLPDTATVKIN